MENNILYARNVAKTLGIPFELAQSLMREADFPSDKEGGILRVTRKDFLNWIEREAVRSQNTHTI